MTELEQQVAEHNILQKEIDAYGQELRNLVGPVREPPHVYPCPSPIRARARPTGLWGEGWRLGAQRAQHMGCQLPAPRLSLDLCFLPLGRSRTQPPSRTNTETYW